ncbi:MAG: FAD-binding protein, partial [Chloroflexota bacterium]|nr:FAD-binding protein [Chloroflexota bacterium]
MSATAERISPNTYQLCAEALAEASARKRSVRIRGAGTKDYLGDLRPTDLTVETTALRGIVAHVPADLTVTVAAGTPLVELQAALAGAGQFLPLDPPHGDRATIGGIVAANSTGFWRARYGGVRDLLIGTVTALADGTLAHAGGRVVKNVAGYDLDKLLVGSLGTLGLITECTFKILPLPKSTGGLRSEFARASDAFAAADAVARTPARP